MAKPIRLNGKWRIRWTDHGGVRRSEVYDRFDIAEAQLSKKQAETWEVQNGHRFPVIPGKTFNDLCDEWLNTRALQKRSGNCDKSIIQLHLRPNLGATHLQRFDSSHVDRYRALKSQVNKKTLHNHLTLLASMLRLGHERKWMLERIQIKKPKLSKAHFHYLRTEEEVSRFLCAASEIDPIAHLLYAAAIYTGLRAGELAGLQWNDIDLHRRLITVQRSFDGPTKSDAIRHVPILDPILPLLREWKLKWPGPSVFPNRCGNMFGPSARVFQEVFKVVLRRAEFSDTLTADGKPRGYIRFHDLRHTFASHWIMHGGEIFKLQRILGHSDIKMTMRYAHLSPDAFVNDYSRFGSVTPGRRAEVLPFQKRSFPVQAK